MATGYSPDHPYSKAPDVIRRMVIEDILDHGFDITCKTSGVKLTIRPGGSLCEEVIQSLYREWYGEPQRITETHHCITR